MSEYDYVIVGGGVAGLYFAFRLLQKGERNFIILEGSDHVGGRNQVYKFHDTVVPLGAGAFRSTDKAVLALVKELKIPILTDVHSIEQCSIVAKHVDVLQIPAFLCRQTDLLVEAAKTNKIINVKKGQFLAPWDMVNVTKKISDSGNENILVTERGASFGYNNLVSDMRSLPIMAKIGYPVIFDATHSVQQPGGQGEKSGGQREFIEHLARAAVAVGVAGVFIETHQDPDNAPSDGPNMIPINKLENLLKQLNDIDSLIKASE